jgi:hypothetical protein
LGWGGLIGGLDVAIRTAIPLATGRSDGVPFALSHTGEDAWDRDASRRGFWVLNHNLTAITMYLQ